MEIVIFTCQNVQCICWNKLILKLFNNNTLFKFRKFCTVSPVGAGCASFS